MLLNKPIMLALNYVDSYVLRNGLLEQKYTFGKCVISCLFFCYMISLLEKHNMEQVLAWFYTQFSRSLSIFTARKRSCRKVMFSQLSGWPQGLGVGISGPMSFLGVVGYLWYQVPSRGWVCLWYPPQAWHLGVGMSGGMHTHLHSRKSDTTGYGRQAGSVHLTGMLSC